MFITDSIFDRIKLINAKIAERFIRKRGGDESAPEFEWRQFVSCVFDIGEDIDVFQFVFGSWKASDGITDQMKEIIGDASLGTNVTTVSFSWDQ